MLTALTTRIAAALQAALRDLGGMVSAPVRTLRRIANGQGAGATLPIVLLLLVTLGVNAKVMTRFALLLEHGADTMMRRVREVLTQDLRTDAIVLVCTCGALALLAQVLAGGRVLPARAATAAVWLAVPLILLKAVGGALDALNLDVWFLPSSAVDSAAVFIKGEVSWTRFAIKCATAYGVPLVLGLLLVASFRSHAPPAEAPLPAWRARVGVGVAVAVLVAFTGVMVSDVVRHADRIRPVLPGDALPDVALRELTVDGVTKKKISMQSFHGQVLVLDFWASWCNPCRRSMPELSDIADAYRDKGVVVLGVNREPQDPKAAARALKEIGPRFPSVIDDRFFGDKLGLTTLPSSYIVDAAGTVRHFHMGYVEPSVVRAELDALLASDAAARHTP